MTKPTTTPSPSPLAGMPNTKDAWKAHMKTQAGGQDAIDLDAADRLGLDQDTVDKLHKADTNKDGKLDWDEAWKAFDDFDSNGDSSSVDLAKLGKSESALAFARGLNTVHAANTKEAKLHTTKSFDPTKRYRVNVGGRTVEFPPGALAKKPVVDKDYLDRPEITFQLADGTDGRLYNDPKQGWVAVVDHQHYKAGVGASGTIEIKGVLKDDAKANVVEGHALQIRSGGGSWNTIANDRAKSFTLDAGKTTIDRGKGMPKFEVNDGARFETAWRGKGKSAKEYSFHFRDGRQVDLVYSGRNKYMVRTEGGDLKSLKIPADRVYSKLTVQSDGTIRAEQDGLGAQGGKVDIYNPDGSLKRTLDFSDDKPRDKLKTEGAAQVAKGDAAGLALVNKAYKEQVDHGLVIRRIGAQQTKQETLAPSYGKRMGTAIADLAAAGKVDEAKALQKKMVEQMYGSESAFTETSARNLAFDAYTKAILDKGEPTASALLPDLPTTISAQKAEPSSLYMSEKTYDKLDALAQTQVKAGKLDAAKALYLTARNSGFSSDKSLLSGRRSKDAYTVKAGDGSDIALNDPPSGHRIATYDGVKTTPNRIAETKAAQISFSQDFRKEAAKLPGLTLTADELNAVPPSPQTMKKYFAAKYSGQMPAKMEDMRAELDRYMKVAYEHPQLNVPDTVKGWNGTNLPTMADGRIAADCFCTNRAVAHMLSGVDGLKIHAVENDGHSRLAITSADGKQGFVQSNNETAKLEGSGSLKDRIEHTISKNEGLQVFYGMPAPVRVGAGFATGAGLTDVDKAFDGDFADTSKQLGGVSTSSTDGKMLAAGKKVRDVVQRYEAFRTKADKLVSEAPKNPSDAEKAALDKKKAELLKELEQLEKDVSSLRGQVPSQMRRFLDNQRKDGGPFEVGHGKKWLQGKAEPYFVNGKSMFSLGGSSW